MDKDMARTCIMTGMGMGTRQICTSTSPCPFPIEKVGYSPHSYLYPINAKIFHQNGNEFGQYT